MDLPVGGRECLLPQSKLKSTRLMKTGVVEYPIVLSHMTLLGMPGSPEFCKGRPKAL